MPIGRIRFALHAPLAAPLLALVLTAGVTACGGDDGGSAATTVAGPIATGGGAAVETTPSGSGGGAGDVTPVVDANLRFVNFFVKDGRLAAIDVWIGAPGKGKKVVDNLTYGIASDWIALGENDSYSIMLAGDTESKDVLMSKGETVPPGERFSTLVYAHQRDDGTTGAGVQVVSNKDSVNFPDPQVAGAKLIGLATPVDEQLGQGDPGFVLGGPDGGCFKEAGAQEGITNIVGGTGSVVYDVPAGTTEVAAYAGDDATCSKTPRIAAREVNVVAQGRTYVVINGTGPNDLHLTPLAT